MGHAGREAVPPVTVKTSAGQKKIEERAEAQEEVRAGVADKHGKSNDIGF